RLALKLQPLRPLKSFPEHCNFPSIQRGVNAAPPDLPFRPPSPTASPETAADGGLRAYAVDSQLPIPTSQRTSNAEEPIGGWMLGILWEVGVAELGIDTYLLYSSTISCSCTGRLICSRVGSDEMRPLIWPASNDSQSGMPRPFTSSIACWM